MTIRNACKLGLKASYYMASYGWKCHCVNNILH